MSRVPPAPVPQDPVSGSAAANWPALVAFIDREHRFGERMAARPATAAGYEFVRFGVKQAWACLFGGIMVMLMIATSLFYPKTLPLSRYDVLFLAALSVQALLLWLRMETLEEAKVIFTYHLVGTGMEVFKTAVGSWIYPEASIFHIYAVPLFSGFMYSCIGSYLCRAWRLFDFRFTHHPPIWTLVLLSLAIYINFFLHHYLADVRPVLFLGSFILFARTTVYFKVWRRHRRMPLLLGLSLVSVFIWISENIGTYTRTWLYPGQLNGWTMVSWNKLGAWFLLLVISYTLVALINKPQAYRQASASKDDALPVGADAISVRAREI